MRHSKDKIKRWFPLWIDSWLFGSMRHEFAPDHDLRAIFLDLLALSKKDEGYIRANEETPYPLEQLAGMFCVQLDRLQLCIQKCLATGKLTEVSPGIYYVTKHDEYELTERHKRRFEEASGEMSPKTDTMAENGDTKGKERKGKERKEEKKRKRSIILYKDKKLLIPDDVMEDLVADFSRALVEREIPAMERWLKHNKPKKDYNSFVFNWLNREQKENPALSSRPQSGLVVVETKDDFAGFQSYLNTEAGMRNRFVIRETTDADGVSIWQFVGKNIPALFSKFKKS